MRPAIVMFKCKYELTELFCKMIQQLSIEYSLTDTFISEKELINETNRYINLAIQTSVENVASKFYSEECRQCFCELFYSVKRNVESIFHYFRITDHLILMSPTFDIVVVAHRDDINGRWYDQVCDEYMNFHELKWFLIKGANR